MKTKTPDMAPLQFSADDGDGEITVGTWSEGVGFRIRTADGRTVILRLAQLAAIKLANQIMYAVDFEDGQLPILDASGPSQS